MAKRVRSPNYPAISLRDALAKAELLYKNLHTHAAPREVIATAMGYASLNGSSMTAISALNKYGLLDGRGDEIKISDRARRILHPETEEERARAIRDAASDPELFSELDERFPGATPNEELLRNYLLRRNFSSSAVSQVIRSYRETKELVEAESHGYDSLVLIEGPASVQSPQPASDQPRSAAVVPQNRLQNQLVERSIGHYDFEGGGYIRLSVGGEIATEEALDMAEIIISLKRKEIERRKETAKIVQESDSNTDRAEIEDE